MTSDFDVTTLFGRRADQRWNRLVVGDILERLRWSRPDKVALTGWHGAYGSPEFASLTYAEADAAANRVAQALVAEGLEQGARVLLYCDNSVEAILLLFGIAKAGMVAVPVNPLLASDVLAWVIEHVEVSFAVVDAEFGARSVPVLADAGLRVGVTIPIGGDAIEGSTVFADWIAAQPDAEVDTVVHADDVWALLFTSGTTAMPKASMSTHTYSYLNAYAYVSSLNRGLTYPDDLKVCCFLPVIYHCGHNSTVMPAALSGGSFLIGRRPDPTALAEAITAERATAVWAGSPAWVEALAEVALARPDDIDLTSLTVAMFSWGAMNPNMATRLRAACGDIQMLEVFGQTESMSSFRFWPDQFPEKFEQSMNGVNYVGLPTPILAADIVDLDGRSLRGEPHAPGEAVYRSPVISAGYYKDEAATREAFRGGWFHSGDICAVDADGQQIMVDRMKDIVKSGGENVSSLRVEGVLAGHPAVERVAVIGLPSERWGEEVTAVVVLRAPGAVSETDLVAFARTQLAGYEAPKRVIVIEEMPVTVGGKIQKYQLRDRFRGDRR